MASGVDEVARVLRLRTGEAAAVLKGNGNEADFLGFLQKSVRHRSLTLYFEPFRF